MPSPGRPFTATVAARMALSARTAGPYSSVTRRDLRRRDRRRRARHRRRRLAAVGVLAVAAVGGLALGLTVAAGDEGAGPPEAPEQPAAATVPAQGNAAGPPTPADRGPDAYSGTGKLVTVAGTSERSGDGPLERFTVAVEEGLPVDPEAFAAEVERTLFDARSWGAVDGVSFQRVDSGAADFRVVLASPDKTDQLCLPHDTHGIYSCYESGDAVLNVYRWEEGAKPYGSDLVSYRRYLINHETGHAIGHSAHAFCEVAGEPAPVMAQQTKGVRPCKANPWPLESEALPGY